MAVDIKKVMRDMSDSENYPLVLEAQAAYIDIAREKIDEIKAQIKALPPDKRLEKKALSISNNMAELCATFISFIYTAKSIGTIDKDDSFIGKRRVMLRNAGMEPDTSGMTPDEEGEYLLFVHATYMLHNAFIDKHTEEIVSAYESGHPERAFEANIIIDVVFGIVRRWVEWRSARGLRSFDKWSYDTHPAYKYREAEV